MVVLTWDISICGSSAPGGHRSARKELHPVHALGNFPGRDGVLEVLPPGQGGTQQAEGLSCACGALQNAIYLLYWREIKEWFGGSAGQVSVQYWMSSAKEQTPAGSPTKEHPHRRSYQAVGPSNQLNEAQSKTQSQPSRLFSTGIQFTTLRAIGVCHTSAKKPMKI